MLILNRQEVEHLLDLDQLIDALAPGMIALSAGELSMPPRIVALVPDHDGLLANMPVYLPAAGILSTKLVSVYPHNPAAGLPAHQALIALFDPQTGTLLAVMDGAAITAVRTAAGSALATRLLARPDARTLVIVGTGVQARAHALAIPRVRPIGQIRIVGRSPDKTAQLADVLSAELGMTVRTSPSFREAAAGAQIICATTHAPEAVVFGRWLEPGTHINSVGLHPAGGELDAETVLKGLLVVESRQAVLAAGPGGAADLTELIRQGVITADHIQAEVGEILTGAHPGRTSDEQITIYRSVGVAVQDAVAAQLVLNAAREQGLGVEVAI